MPIGRDKMKRRENDGKKKEKKTHSHAAEILSHPGCGAWHHNHCPATGAEGEKGQGRTAHGYPMCP